MIPLSEPNICGNEKKYVNQALDAGWVSTVGSFVNKFEEDIAAYVKAKYAVACQSGTAGLHLALKYAQVQVDELVIVPTLTFISPVNTVKYVGAAPVFMDCDDSLCMDAVRLLKFCTTKCKFLNGKLIHVESGKRIRAIVVVHIFGNLCDMEKIMQVATQFNLFLIEDATEALGSYYLNGTYEGKHAGTIGDIGVYSFNGNKIITTGGGGMVVCNEKGIADKIRYWSTQSKDDALYFIHNEVGYNYRMTNVQAAIGVAQLELLNGFIATKERNYYLYQTLLQDEKSLKLLPFSANVRPNFWFYSVCLSSPELIEKRDYIIDKLNAAGIQVRPVWGLINQQKPYEGDMKDDIVCAAYFAKCIINIPCSSTLNSDSANLVVNELKKLIVELTPPPEEVVICKINCLSIAVVHSYLLIPLFFKSSDTFPSCILIWNMKKGVIV